MLVKVRFQGEGLVTSTALKVLGRRVCLHVGTQVGPVSKRLLTHGAEVRLVSCVGPQMALQEPWSGKGLVTNRALVVEVVSEDVHGEGWHGDVHLSTHMALFSMAGVKRPMGLFVPAEVRTGSIVFSTLRTAVMATNSINRLWLHSYIKSFTLGLLVLTFNEDAKKSIPIL